LLDVANVAMLFLLTVVLVAIRLGRGPAITATLTGFCALVLAAPRRAYDAGEFKYAVALGVMLAVGWITARLTADLRAQAEAALARESHARSLYEFARALSVALQAEQVFEITHRVLARGFDARCAILLPDEAGRLAWPAANGLDAAQPGTRATVLSVLDMAAAQWAYDHASPSGAGTATLPSNAFLYLPLLAPVRTRGVLAVRAARGDLLAPDRRALLDAYAALAAIALERVHYVEVAQDAQVAIEGERLRNSLLAALSHDLRTPLTSLVGLSEALTLSRPPLPAAQMELAGSLCIEARRMSTLVANLLDMARIQSGGVRLNLQWQVVEETVGSAIHACRWQLGSRGVETRIPRDLPLVRFDAVLLERVLCNLLENAGKYTPPSARIVVAAEARDARLLLRVCDDGPGLPAGREDALFEKFVRGSQESPIAGVGLGLAICRALVEAHGGAMRAWSLPAPGGACFEIALPLHEPPLPPALDADDALHEKTLP
jgi:two-component system sensor histidine kinase KdpD